LEVALNALQRTWRQVLLQLGGSFVLIVIGLMIVIDSLAHANKPHELVNEHWVALCALCATALGLRSALQIRRAWKNHLEQPWKFGHWLLFIVSALFTVISGFFAVVAIAQWFA